MDPLSKVLVLVASVGSSTSDFFYITLVPFPTFKKANIKRIRKEKQPIQGKLQMDEII